MASETGVRPFVYRLYDKVLRRTPDEEGLSNWCRWIESGEQTPESAAKLFFSSKEYTSKETGNYNYVYTLYGTFLGRMPDQPGLEYWVRRLEEGTSRTEILEGFSRSKEFADILKSYGL